MTIRWVVPDPDMGPVPYERYGRQEAVHRLDQIVQLLSPAGSSTASVHNEVVREQGPRQICHPAREDVLAYSKDITIGKTVEAPMDPVENRRPGAPGRVRREIPQTRIAKPALLVLSRFTRPIGGEPTHRTERPKGLAGKALEQSEVANIGGGIGIELESELAKALHQSCNTRAERCTGLDVPNVSPSSCAAIEAKSLAHRSVALPVLRPFDGVLPVHLSAVSLSASCWQVRSIQRSQWCIDRQYDAALARMSHDYIPQLLQHQCGVRVAVGLGIIGVGVVRPTQVDSLQF